MRSTPGSATIRLRSLDEDRELKVHWLADDPKTSPATFRFGEHRRSLEGFPPGRYEVFLECEGFKEVREEFHLEPWKNPVITLVLKR